MVMEDRSLPMLVFIVLFVWIGAAQESRMVQMKSALEEIPLSPDDGLGRAVELILAGHQQDFLVVQGSTIVGVLTRADLLSALARSGQGALVGDVMQRDFQLADAHEMLEVAFA